MLRHQRNCTRLEDQNQCIATFHKALLNRGFRKKTLEDIETVLNTKHTKKTKHTLRKKKAAPLIFKSKYNPAWRTKNLKKCILKHWHLIEEDAILKEIFPKKPILCFQRDKNIKDSLIKSRLKPTQDEQNFAILRELLEEAT